MLKNVERIHFLILTFLIIIIWTWVFIFQVYQKTSFLDDAFIYLTIARNILDIGTAQFFPVSSNQSLLASSPLRLLVLIPSTWIARLFTDVNASLETARLTFYFSGILSSLIFIPFFTKNRKIWYYSFIFAGLLSLSTQTALQMEGILLFWVGLSLLTLLSNQAIFDQNGLRKIGYLIGLFLLTRPEYGIVAFSILLGIVFYQRNFSLLRAYCVPIVICGVCWIVISLFLLHVWPIPTTYLSKIITAQLNQFGPKLSFYLPSFVNNFFFKNFYINTYLILGFGIAYVLIIAWKNVLYRFVASFIVIVVLIISQSAGNYFWYYENFFITFLTIGFFIVLTYSLKMVKQNLLSVIFSSLILLMFIRSSLNYNPDFSWNFTKVSSALSYQNISTAHIEQGIFKFDGLPPTYIRMIEIGIVSYFANNFSLWIYDTGGLAQAGTLKGVKDSFFANFYPSSILVDGAEEYTKLCNRFKSKDNKCQLHDAWAIYDYEGISKVQYYYDDLKVGLNWVNPEKMPFNNLRSKMLSSTKCENTNAKLSVSLILTLLKTVTWQLGPYLQGQGQYYASILNENNATFFQLPLQGTHTFAQPLSTSLKVKIKYVAPEGWATCSPLLVLDPKQVNEQGLVKINWQRNHEP